jgi:hypothetical protein
LKTVDNGSRNKSLRSGLLVAAMAASSAALAQSGAYYVTEGTSGPGNTYVMQGGSLQFSYAWAADAQMPIVIGDFGSGTRVRQAAGQPTTGAPQQGDEYELNGTPTGFTNFWDSGDPAGTTAYDAGFDAQSIYMAHWGGATDGQIFRYDNNYGNGVFLFAAQVGDLGITYDSSTGTIWTSNWFNGTVTQYALNGTQLFQYSPAGNSVGALAYDASDDTFWMALNGAGQLAQYSRSGTLLQTVTAPNYVLGGEFAAVPEPGTIVAVCIGLASLALARRRK